MTRLLDLIRKNPVPWGIAAIWLVGWMVYGRTLDVPWYFDDQHAIVDNPLLRDLGANLRRVWYPRGFADLTFALNYRLGGDDPAGYHVFNIAVHLMAASCVYLILRRLIHDAGLLPLLGALLFLVHPLQTQAVTYVVQRYASLAGLFTFAALYAFIRARSQLTHSGRFTDISHLAWYLAALLLGAMAVFTKQNAAFLPVALLALLWVVPELRPADWRRAFLSLLPFFIAPCLTAAWQFGLLHGGTISLEHAGAADSLMFLNADNQGGRGVVSPLFYLFTEFSVIWVYLRLMVLPYGQALDYGYPVVEHLLTAQNMAALGGLLLLVALALYCRSRKPLVSAGIFWFFLALAVESSIIVLDPLFEHRLYIPLFGFVLVLTAVSRPFAAKQAFCLLLAGVVALFAVLAWERNELWRNSVAFLEDNARSRPENYRIYHGLAQEYRKTEPDRAISVLEKSLEVNPFAWETYITLAVLYSEQGDAAKATTLLKRAIGLNPANANAYLNLGKISEDQGQRAEAERFYRRAIELKPDFGIAYYNLGVLLYQQHRQRESLDALRQAVRFRRQDADALYNLAVVAAELRDRREVAATLEALRSLDPAKAAQLEESLRE
ncbi:MAG: tetratricopeptide repeat protein [Geobacter sp.]|nr:tetratricopeptide repeat protein [Geobacter sp.]